MKGFILINESTAPEITPALLEAFAVVLTLQQAEIDEWYQGTAWQVVVADSEAAAPQGDQWILVKFVDELDDKEALAYHTVTDAGRPVILMGVAIIRANAPPGTDWLAGPDSLLTATSHELPETRANPYVALYVPFDANTWIPQEVCDPVQGDSYEYPDHPGFHLSNFVGPRYWSDGEGPYDRMGLVTAPRQIRPGGYQQRLTGGPAGASTAVFGALPHEGGMADWKRIAKEKAGTRFAKIAARATGTDDRATAMSLTSEVVSQHAAKIDALSMALEETGTELEALQREHERVLGLMKSHVCAGTNGGHGG